MDPISNNCELLRNQCLELKSEIAVLNNKLGKLLETICLKDHVEAACQTEAINSTTQHVECQTGVISYQFQDFPILVVKLAVL